MYASLVNLLVTNGKNCLGWDPNYNKDEESKNLVVYDYGSVMHYKKTDGSRKAYLPAMEVS